MLEMAMMSEAPAMRSARQPLMMPAAWYELLTKLTMMTCWHRRWLRW